MLLSVSALNRVDLPTLGSPTIPIESELMRIIITEVGGRSCIFGFADCISYACQIVENRTKCKPIMNREIIGVVGGGQIGRMMTEAALPLGFEVVVIDPTPNCPAAQAGASQIEASLMDG